MQYLSIYLSIYLFSSDHKPVVVHCFAIMSPRCTARWKRQRSWFVFVWRKTWKCRKTPLCAESRFWEGGERRNKDAAVIWKYARWSIKWWQIHTSIDWFHNRNSHICDLLNNSARPIWLLGVFGDWGGRRGWGGGWIVAVWINYSQHLWNEERLIGDRFWRHFKSIQFYWQKFKKRTPYTL